MVGCWEMNFYNVWWRGNIGKNIAKRFAWSIFEIVVTAKSMFTIICSLIALVLIVLGIWLKATTVEQQYKFHEPLVSLDVAVNGTVDSLNFLTQDVPEKAQVFLNDSVTTIQDGSKAVIENVIGSCETICNNISVSISETANKITAYFYSLVGQSNPPVLSMPKLSIVRPTLAQTWSFTELVDTSAIRIPTDRDFSFNITVGQFVDEACETFYTISDYLFYIGIGFACYVALALLIACCSPWVPRMDPTRSGTGSKICCTIIKFPVLFAKGIFNAFQMLLMPWIFVPLIVGLVIVIVMSPSYDFVVDEINLGVRVPLRRFDDFINDNIYETYNEIVITVPPNITDGINVVTTKFSSDIYDGYSDIQFDAIREVNLALRSFTNVTQTFLRSINVNLNLVNTYQLTPQSLGLKFPSRLIPLIPDLNLTDWLIDRNRASLERAMTPWLDRRISDMRDVGETFFVVGLWLLVIPAIIVALVCLFPFTPRPIDQFFRYREYKMDPELAKKNAAAVDSTSTNAPDTEMTSKSPSTPSKGGFAVSEPTYVDK